MAERELDKAELKLKVIRARVTGLQDAISAGDLRGIAMTLARKRIATLKVEEVETEAEIVTLENEVIKGGGVDGD